MAAIEHWLSYWIGNLRQIDRLSKTGGDWSPYGEPGVYASVCWNARRLVQSLVDRNVKSNPPGNLGRSMPAPTLFQAIEELVLIQHWLSRAEQAPTNMFCNAVSGRSGGAPKIWAMLEKVIAETYPEFDPAPEQWEVIATDYNQRFKGKAIATDYNQRFKRRVYPGATAAKVAQVAKRMRHRKRHNA